MGSALCTFVHLDTMFSFCLYVSVWRTLYLPISVSLSHFLSVWYMSGCLLPMCLLHGGCLSESTVYQLSVCFVLSAVWMLTAIGSLSTIWRLFLCCLSVFSVYYLLSALSDVCLLPACYMYVSCQSICSMSVVYMSVFCVSALCCVPVCCISVCYLLPVYILSAASMISACLSAKYLQSALRMSVVSLYAICKAMW